MLSRLANWWRQRQRARREALTPERLVHVAWDEAGVTAGFPDGTRQSVAWDALVRVAIETNDSGPWGADVWWLLEGSGSRLAYPQGVTGDGQLLGELQRRLPGFSDEAVILAMACTDNARFVCWERAEAGSPGPRD